MDDEIKRILEQDEAILAESPTPAEPDQPQPPPPRKKKPGFWARLTGTGKITPEDMAKAKEKARRLTP
jgi:hypothetical protein